MDERQPELRKDDVDEIEFMARQMTVDPMRKLNHKKELAKAATKIDQKKNRASINVTTEDFKELKEKLLACETVEETMSVLYDNKAMHDAMCSVTQDICHTEIVSIDSSMLNL